MSRILLTGASGFIGRHTLRILRDAGHEVHAAGRRPPTLDGVEWHGADLLSDQSVISRVRPEVLVHLAWFAEPGAFWTAPDNLRWLESSLVMLRTFVAAGGRRAVLAGTCAEYEWREPILSEQTPLHPATLYGAAKHALHVAAAAYAEQEAVELAWGRLFFLYGTHEDPRRFVASLVRKLLRGESAPMTAGAQVRDFLNSRDAGAAFAALAESHLTGAFNIASGQGVSLREVALETAALAGAPELLQIGALPMRAGEPLSLVADVTRLQTDLAFTPTLALRPGLAETVEWWRQQLDESQVGNP